VSRSPACFGDLFVLAGPTAKPRGVKLTELFGERAFGSRDWIIGRRFENDPATLIFQHDG
jgi:hypothetical protein